MDIYRIQVEMMLAGNLAQMLTHIGASMTGLEGQANKIKNAFGGWGIALAAVGAALTAGAIVEGLKGVYDQTKKISDEVAKVKALGATPEELSRVHQEAVNVTRHVSGTTEVSATEIYKEAVSIMGPEEALKAMEPLSRVAQLMGSVSGNYEKANSQVFDLIRSADIMGRMVDATGKFDLDKLTSFLQIVGKTYEATGGKVDSSTWLGLAKQGGISLRGLNDEGMARMAVFSQAMGGQRAGTAMMSMFQQFAGGTMFPRVAEELQRLGILKEGEWKKESGKVTVTPEATKRMSEYFAKDPAEGIKFLKDAMVKIGITDPNAQVRELFRLLQRATTQRFVGEGMMNDKQMEAEVQRIMKAPEIIEALKMLDTTSIPRAEHNLNAALEELGQAIGGPHAEFIAAGIGRVTEAIRGLTEIVRAIPETGLAGLAKLTGVTDFLRALVQVMPGGAIVTSLNEIVGALSLLGRSSEGLHNAAAAIRKVIESITGFFGGSAGTPNGGAAKPTSPELPPVFGGTSYTGPGAGIPRPQNINFIQPYPTPALGGTGYFGPDAGGPRSPNINFTQTEGPDLRGRSFAPPQQKTEINNHTTTVNLDGETIARLIESRIAQNHELSDSASSSNGVAHPTLNDWNSKDN